MSKQTAVEWLKNLFRKKSPCCRCKINFVGVHYYYGGGESNIYECSKCKKQWTYQNKIKGGEQ